MKRKGKSNNHIITQVRCIHCNGTKYLKRKFVIDSFRIYFCNYCQNGFTYPSPKKITKFYPQDYWISPGIIGYIRKIMYKIFQSRRRRIIRKYLKEGVILDVGAGEGVFAQTMDKNFQVVSIDAPFANIKNKDVLKIDFLKWKTHKKFDAIVFWESLEHVENPKQYLEKTREILKKEGILFIEYPNFHCLESMLFQKNWYHLEVPRHLSHFTRIGLKNLLNKTGFQEIYHLGVLAPEYAVWGFIASFFEIFKIEPKNLVKILNRGIPFFLIFPLCVIAIILELLFWVFGQSPILFTVSRREN